MRDRRPLIGSTRRRQRASRLMNRNFTFDPPGTGRIAGPEPPCNGVRTFLSRPTSFLVRWPPLNLQVRIPDPPFLPISRASSIGVKVIGPHFLAARLHHEDEATRRLLHKAKSVAALRAQIEDEIGEWERTVGSLVVESAPAPERPDIRGVRRDFSGPTPCILHLSGIQRGSRS